MLLQLPPSLRLDFERLAAYPRLLPRDLRYAFEFRDPSWFTTDLYALLREHNAALCLAESEKLEVPDMIIAYLANCRLRKPGYGDADIERFAARSRGLLATDRLLVVV